MIAKSQDVVVALALVALNRAQEKRLPYEQLGKILGISGAEAFKATRRLVDAGLVDAEGNRPLLAHLRDYVIRGVPYAFPGKLGAPIRGVPTAWAAPMLGAMLPQGADLPPVWPWAEGKVRGYSVEPLFPSVPQAVQNLPSLYPMLALVDALRIGRSRDRAIARDELERSLMHDSAVAER